MDNILVSAAWSVELDQESDREQRLCHGDYVDGFGDRFYRFCTSDPDDCGLDNSVVRTIYHFTNFLKSITAFSLK